MGGADRHNSAMDLNEAWLARFEASDHSGKVGSRHHLLPQFYMRYFENSDHKILTIDRDTGKRNPRATADQTLSEKNYYTFVNTGMQDDGSVEDLLSVIEANAKLAFAQMLSRYRQYPISPDHRLAISNFAALQIARGRKSRRHMEVFADLSVRVLVSSVKDEHVKEHLQERGMEATESDITEFIEFRDLLPDLEIHPPTNEHIKFMLNFLHIGFPNFMARPITHVHFNEPCIVTSDEPFIPVVDNQFRSAGIGSADEIYFPLTPSDLLIFGRKGDPAGDRYLEISIGEFDYEFFNRGMLWHSFQLVIANPDYSYKGLEVMPPKEPFISILGGEDVIPEEFHEQLLRRQTVTRFRSHRDIE